MSRRRGEEPDDSIFAQNETEWLNQSFKAIRENHKKMLRATDVGDVNEAFKYAAAMCDELRTSLLTPKTYYQLYMEVFTKLRDLEVFVGEQNRKGTPMSQLYERAQYTTNVLSRLYLLICVGSVYMNSGEAPVKGVLKDLVEMAKGIQHPMRGLFLRYYLSQCTKDKLPNGNSTNPANGVLQDSLDFVLANFVEMNKLWVRMQYIGSSRDRARRERERKDLRTLLGTNLVTVANLDGVDERVYESFILPAILEQVVNCHDATSQHYLMEIIVQMFPCEFHLISLKKYLACFAKLEDGVDVEELILRLIERITAYYYEESGKKGGDASSPVFDILSSSINEVLKSRRATVKTAGKLRLYEALLKLVITVYPSESLADYIDRVYQKCLAALDSAKPGSISAQQEVNAVNTLIQTPMKHAIEMAKKAAELAEQANGAAVEAKPHYTMKDMLRLQHISSLLALLAPEPRKNIATVIMDCMNQAPPVIDQPELLEKLFEFVRPLLIDDTVTDEEEEQPDTEEFEAEQNKISRISHMLYSEDTDALFRLLYIARKNFGKGGVRRVRFVLTPLFFVALRLAERVSRIERAEAEGADGETGEAGATEDGQAPPTSSTEGGEGEGEKTEGEGEGEEGQKEGEPTTFAQNTAVAPRKGKSSVLIHSEKVFQFVMEIIGVIGKHIPELGIRMCTQAMLSADRCMNQQSSYEFMSQACIIYEEYVANSHVQFAAIRTFVGSLQQTKYMDEDNYDTLIKKTTQYSSKLVKRPDQARAVCLCSHLFWTERDGTHPFHDSNHVVECLKRSGELADKIAQLNIQTTVFAEILNEHLYFLSKGIDKPTANHIVAIITFIGQRLPGLDEQNTGPMQAYYANTIKHIETQKATDESDKNKFKEINLPTFN